MLREKLENCWGLIFQNARKWIIFVFVTLYIDLKQNLLGRLMAWYSTFMMVDQVWVENDIIITSISQFFLWLIKRKYLCWRWNWAFNDEWKIQFNLRKLRIVFKLIILQAMKAIDPSSWKSNSGIDESSFGSDYGGLSFEDLGLISLLYYA